MDRHRISFSWDIIYKCNYRCPYCWWDGKWTFLSVKNRYLSVEEIMRPWLRVYNMYGRAHIDILGGEPFVYPNFAELIRELSKLHTITITTNLFCDIEPIVKVWDSSKVKINPTFHPMFANLEEFRKKAKALKEEGFTQNITYLAYPPQINKLNYYKDIFQEDNLQFSILTFWGKYNSRDYPDAYTEDEKMTISPNIAQRNNENFQLSPIKSFRGKSCYAGCRYACIHPDGETFRCGGSGAGGFPEMIGNFFDKDFKLLDGPIPCPSAICPCNEWSFLLEETIGNEASIVNDLSLQKQQLVAEQDVVVMDMNASAARDNFKVEINNEDACVEFSWEICYTCNYRCPYCERWNDVSDSDVYLGAEEWERIWRRIYDKYGSCNMYISGAEPSTYLDFFDIVQRVAQMHTVTVCTNFSWDIKEILDRNFNRQRFQFTPTFHSLFCDFNLFLTKAIKLKEWIRNKMIFFVAYPGQMKKVEYYKKSVNENGLDFCIVPLRGSVDGHMEVVSGKEEKDKINLITDMSEDEFAYLSQKSLPKGKPCRAGYRYAIIRPTGEVFPCSQDNRSLGNISNNGFVFADKPSICPAKFCPYESHNLLERYGIPAADK